MHTYLVKIRQAHAAPRTLRIIAKCSIDALSKGIDLLCSGAPSSISVRLA